MRALLSVSLTVLLTATSCGGSGGSNNPTSPTSTIPATVTSSCSGGTAKGTMSARIDGVTWTATCIVTASVDSVFCHCLSVAGGNSAIPQVVVGGGALDRPGTYPIGGVTDPANGLVLVGSASPPIWAANAVQGNGIFTIATLTATSASGTFAFNATGGPIGGPITTKMVTEGVFDVTF